MKQKRRNVMMSNMVDCDCILMEKEIVGIRMTLYQCPACFRTISKPNEVKKQVKKSMKTYIGYVINAMNMGIRRPGRGAILNLLECECIGGICTCSIPATSEVDEVDEAEEIEEEAEHLINIPGPILPCQISNDEEAELLMSAPGPRHRQISERHRLAGAFGPARRSGRLEGRRGGHGRALDGFRFAPGAGHPGGLRIGCRCPVRLRPGAPLGGPPPGRDRDDQRAAP